MSSHSTSTAIADDPRIGRVLVDRFRIIERIATGGMGIVYKAEQMPLGREVVIKVLESKHLPDIDDTFRQRFFLEAAAAAKLHHPNTIVVYDYGQAEDGEYYIAMELVEGGTLGRRLKDRGPLTPAQAVHVALQVCSSLRDAHERGLVHRDLKPANVMFAPRAGDPFFVKVLDFGLVKVMANEDEDAAALTQNGLVMGSPRYMSPEQVRSLPVDRRTDIYSFGATLYHMLTGAPPFASGKQFDAMSAHVSSKPPSLTDTWPSCEAGPRLEALVMRCLEKDPEDRFQSMDELMEELYACVEEAGGGVTNSAAYVSHVSLPGLKLAAEQGDSQPRLTGDSGRNTWDSVPNLSGARRRNDPEGETLATASEISVAPPAPDRRWLIVGGVVMLAAGSAVGLWLVPSADPEPAPAAAVAPAADGPAAIAPIQIVSIPPGATVRRNGQDLGDTPLAVPVPRGESWAVEVALGGHQTRTVTLIGGQPHLTVNLAAVPDEDAEDDSDEASDEAPDTRAVRDRRWTPRRRPPTPSPARANDDPPAHDEPARRPVDLHDPWQ